MALLDDQARMYLQLQGRMPEMFLITEIFGRSEKEARQIMEWREEEALRYHPAVHAIRIVAERARLRKELGLPAIENEEATIFEEGTKITQIHGVVKANPDGSTEVTGDEGMPPALRQMLKNELMKNLADMDLPEQPKMGIAHFTGENGPGTVSLPDGRVLHFDSLKEFMDAVANGDIKRIILEGEDEDGEDD